MIIKMGAAFAAALFFAAPVWAEDAPWDFGAPASEEARSPGTLAGDVFSAMVDAYRQNKETTSIHRCAFHVSCSHFAELALARHGVLVGGVMFIDRYFYRENSAAQGLYPWVGEDDGTYRLDDGPFLP